MIGPSIIADEPVAAVIRGLQAIEQKLARVERLAEAHGIDPAELEEVRAEVEVNAIQAMWACPALARAFGIAMRINPAEISDDDGPELMKMFREWLRPARLAGGAA